MLSLNKIKDRQETMMKTRGPLLLAHSWQGQRQTRDYYEDWRSTIECSLLTRSETDKRLLWRLEVHYCMLSLNKIKDRQDTIMKTEGPLLHAHSWQDQRQTRDYCEDWRSTIACSLLTRSETDKRLLWRLEVHYCPLCVYVDHYVD